MPAQVKQSALVAALGPQAQQAAKEAASGEVKWGPDFSRLPPGIKGGIAKLTVCGFEQIDKDYPDAGIKKGDWQYRARAVMVEPETITDAEGNEHKVAGLQTSEFPIWLCRPGAPTASIKRGEKQITPADAVVDIVNKMRMLGANFGANPASELEAVAAALEKAKPYFVVDTSLSKDKTRVWENWNGVRDVPAGYAGPSANGQVQDQTAGSDTEQPVESQEAPAEGGEEEVDVDQLAAEADAMDVNDAIKEGAPGHKLLAVAEQVGADVDACKAAATWADAAEIVKAAAAAAEGGETQAEAPAEPEPLKKGDAVEHFPLVKNKAGKMVKAAKAVPCEIAAMYKNGTADLVQLANRKISYKAVKLDDLQRPA